MKHSGLFIAFFFVTFFCQAQSDGMLWRISGNGLNKPSYLFGTMHITCNKEYVKKPAIKNAIDSSEIVVMELNPNDSDFLKEAMKYMMEPAEKNLSALMTEDEYKVVGKACSELTGFNIGFFDNKKPMVLLTLLYASKEFMGCVSPIQMENIIAGMAKDAKKITIGLESFGFQDSMMSSIPDTTQAKWIVDLCQDIPEAKANFKAMQDVYDAQKAVELYDFILKTSPEMKFEDVLIVQRNIKWVEFLKKRINKHPYFVAVGAGHLGGETGVISLLRKAGYTVVPIIMK